MNTTPQSFVKAAIAAEREQWTGVDKLADAIDRDSYQLAVQQDGMNAQHTQIGLEAIGNLVRTNLQHGGFLVAEFRGSDGQPHSEEAKANAALFTAASALLQKAIALLDRLSAEACDEYGLWDEYIALQEACNQAVGSHA